MGNYNRTEDGKIVKKLRKCVDTEINDWDKSKEVTVEGIKK